MTNRFATAAEAGARAGELTAATGDLHVAYETTYVFNKFAVAAMPKVGDEVSMGFNGDYYPEGKIARISPTYKTITTTTGVRFTRTGQMEWKQGGKRGAFSMVRGHRDERNPHF